MKAQRGFTLVETLIALGLALPLGFALLAVLGTGLRGASAAASLGAQGHALATLVERLDAEAHGSAAIFVPPTDVLGGPACDPSGSCREIDFFTRDAQGVARFWAYRFDPVTLTLTRYAYDDLTASGPVNLRPSGVVIPNVAAFGARRVPISQVAIPALAGYAVADVAIPFGYPGVVGGNALVVVDVRNAAYHRKHDLLPRLTASGFGIVVGTYAPAVPTPVPAATAPALGTPRAYVAYVQWKIGPCVGVPLTTPGCGINVDFSGVQAEEDGADLEPGGVLSAPLDSAIPLGDVCENAAGANPNAFPLAGMIDATGRIYAQVTDPVAGTSELWLVSSDGLNFVPPATPLRPAPNDGSNPIAPNTRSSPGSWYSTFYVVSC